MTKRERALLQHAMQVLGPRATCECEGCAYEIDEALKMLRAVGISYRSRKRVRRGTHDKTAERRGNAMLALVPVRRRKGKLEVDTTRLTKVLGESL